jgi:hypothetical protein
LLGFYSPTPLAATFLLPGLFSPRHPPSCSFTHARVGSPSPHGCAQELPPSHGAQDSHGRPALCSHSLQPRPPCSWRRKSPCRAAPRCPFHGALPSSLFFFLKQAGRPPLLCHFPSSSSAAALLPWRWPVSHGVLPPARRPAPPWTLPVFLPRAAAGSLAQLPPFPARPLLHFPLVQQQEAPAQPAALASNFAAQRCRSKTAAPDSLRTACFARSAQCAVDARCVLDEMRSKSRVVDFLQQPRRLRALRARCFIKRSEQHAVDARRVFAVFAQPHPRRR